MTKNGKVRAWAFLSLAAKKFIYQKRYLVLLAGSLLILILLRQLPPILYNFIGLLDLHVEILNAASYTIAMLLISGSLQSDFKSGAITLHLISPISRQEYLTAKYAGDFLVACFIYSLLFAVGGVAGLLPNASLSLVLQNFCSFTLVILYQTTILYGCNLFIGTLWSFIIGCMSYIFILLMAKPNGGLFESLQNFLHYVLYWVTPHYSEIKEAFVQNSNDNGLIQKSLVIVHYFCTVGASFLIVLKKFKGMNF